MLNRLGDKLAEKMFDEEWFLWPWLFGIVFIFAIIIVGVIGE